MPGFEQTGAGRRWSNRSLVRERDELLTRWLWRTFLAIVVTLAPAGGYIVCKNSYDKLTYEVNELNAQREELLETRRRTNAERAQLESPARIEHWARRQKGLGSPEPGEIVIVRTAGERSPELVAAHPPDASGRIE